MTQQDYHQCEAQDPRDGPHGGSMTTNEGHWLCEQHDMLYNTDGIWLNGRKQKSSEGENPWYNQI